MLLYWLCSDRNGSTMSQIPQWLIDAQAQAAEFAVEAERFEVESQARLERIEARLKKVRKGLMKG